ncbi:MAG: hypothetical protein Q8L35_05655 [Actinomycetota bacterium]|nr:hypothetical protein [Actinomycetota bacterium]
MKKVAVIIVVISLAAILAGCGGGDATTASSESSPTVSTTPATPPGVPVPAAASTTPEKTVPRAIEKKTTTPAFFLDVLSKDQPVLVLFYGEDEISQDVLGEVKKLVDDKYYGGGAIYLLMKLDDNEDIKKLERDFNIGYVPYVAIINRGEEIIFEKNGYIDSQVLEQAVYNAMNK